jgi:predicted nucleic acid-binding protein
LRYHLDTTFIIDWHGNDVRISVLRDEILSGMHEVSIDPIIEAEYFSARHVSREKEMTFDAILAIGSVVALSSEACRLAGSWLGRMDRPQKRRHFNDALIAATAATADAVLVTGDRRIARVFPVAVFEY